MLRCAGGILVALLLALPLAAQAKAQDPEEDGVVVATSGESKMHAREGGEGELCVTVSGPNGSNGTCADRPVVVATRGAVGGAVAPEVTRAEVEWIDGARTSAVPAESAAYPRDRGSPVRFFVIVRGTTRAWLVRLFDAGGRVVRAVQVEPGPRLAGPVRLVRGAARGFGRWRASALLARALVPGPGLPDRTESVPCMVLEVDDLGTTTSCSDGEPRLWRAFEGHVHTIRPPRSNDDLDPRRHLVLGFLRPDAAGAEAYLGEGRRVRLPLRTLVGPGGERVRAIGWTVPARSALRRLVVRGRDGRVIDEALYGLPPGYVRTAPGGIEGFDDPEPPGVPQVAAGPVQSGEGVLRVREVGARLCAEVDGGEPSCGLTPTTSSHSLISGGAIGRAGVVGGIVPPEVATVELRESPVSSPDPQTVRVATQAPAPYAGAFAPHVRAFVAVLPTGGDVKVRLLDDEGRELLVADVDAFPTSSTVNRSRTVLRAGKLRLLAYDGDSDCFHVDDPVGRPVAPCSHSGLSMFVACRPAVSVVVLRTRGHGNLVLITARGRRIAPLRRRIAGGRIAIFVVPAPDVPRALTWRGGRVAFGRLPSPREQCGYRVERLIR